MSRTTTTDAGRQSAIRACRPHGMAGQFGHPTGWRGALVGRLMAFKNQPMNRLAVDLLAAGAGDAVLEIGYGPGQAIRRFVRRTPAASIAGVDPSAVMLRQATRRNRRAIASGASSFVRLRPARSRFPTRGFPRC